MTRLPARVEDLRGLRAARWMAALYERITVTSEGFVGARLTQQAQRHLVALAMPETVALARPEGREHRPATVTIPIEGRRDWRAVVRSA